MAHDTPTVDEVRNNFALGLALAIAAMDKTGVRDVEWPIPGLRAAGKEAFDQFLAQYEKDLRAAIAKDIRKRPVGMHLMSFEERREIIASRVERGSLSS